MVSVLTWVLFGLALYMLVAIGLRMSGWLPEYVKLSGPIVTIHTKRGRALLNRLAARKRLLRAYGNIGVGVSLVVMFLSFLTVVVAGLEGLQRAEPTPLTQPRNALVIPGVNDFLPLTAAPYIVVGLAIGLIVHEGGHGLFCRVGDIDIESMGLVFLTVLPFGAFVEPDEESRTAADRGRQTRMFAAGVTNNFVMAFIAVVLLFGPVAGAISVVDGYHVEGSIPGSPAAQAGIDTGNVIVAVNGTTVEENGDLAAVLDSVTGPRATVSLRSDETVTVDRRLFVQSVSPGSPLSRNATITSVNGTAVDTDAAFSRLVADRELVRLDTSEGAKTVPIGAAVRVAPDGPLAGTGAPAGENLVVTRMDATRITRGEDLQNFMANRTPGEEVTITAYRNTTRNTYNVTLGTDENVSGAYLGVGVFPGFTTMGLADFGTGAYDAAFVIDALTGGSAGPVGDIGFMKRIVVLIILPFLSVLPGALPGFAGFVGFNTSFYVATGPLAVFGTLPVFVLANVLFWTAWINFVIGQFNLIPAFPLDGGHILRTSTEAIVARLPVDRKQALTKTVTITVGLTMLAGLLLAIFGPRVT